VNGWTVAQTLLPVVAALISRMYNSIVPCKDEVNIEVYMNEYGMDVVVFALARKKSAKSMHKDTRDLQQYASLFMPLSNRKWLREELVAIAESQILFSFPSFWFKFRFFLLIDAE